MTSTMKHFFTLMALLLTSVTFGQETCNNVFDYNDNNTIDIEDFLAILGLFADVDLDDDGTWDSLDNCLDLSACNYASELNEPCTYLPPGDCDCNGNVLDECGVCGGTGLAPGTCDCNGTLIDVIGVCGGSCWVDEDEDGICDDVDDCVGEYDACDVCNGPGAIYECGCANIPEGECDCDGNVLDAIGVCGGACSADEDADGLCDDVDDCVGEFDVCGVCNGPGEVYECGCSDVPEGKCDCEGNVLDALGECSGECLADQDGDGVCDDVDDCVGEFDECGVCNGEGDVYECGCNDIPEGECDCDGNVFDECGVCNGPGPTEIVIEDIVTYYDSVYLPFDDAWYVYPVDADTTFGFTCAQPFLCGEPVGYQGYDYETVELGGQCWFAENLKSQNYANGDQIASGLDLYDWYSSTEGAFSTHNINNSGGLYGNYYNEYAVIDARGICPNGWHVPTVMDWNSLLAELGDNAGPKMMTTDGWGWGGDIGTNESGFSALPGGKRYPVGNDICTHCDIQNEANWWASSSEDGNGFRLYNNGQTSIGSYSANYGLSIRCVLKKGCKLPGACNYMADPDSEVDNTVCIFPDGVCETCSGEMDGSGIVVFSDDDGDGVCNHDEVFGCTNPQACNYSESVTEEDGSCDLSCAPEYAGCGNPMVYKGYEYSTVLIGEQCWFSENLRTLYYANGDSVHQGLSSADPTLGATFVYSHFGGGDGDCGEGAVDPCDPEQTLAAYGRLYSWYTIDDARRICPKGWHVPTDAEWMQLEGFLGMDEVELESTGARGTDEGLKMKASDGWNDDGNGTNQSGFNGLPGGIHYTYSYESENGWQWWGEQYGAGRRGHFWTSTLEEENAWQRSLSKNNDMVSRSTSSPYSGLSIRCVLGETGCTDPNACNYDSNPLIESDNTLCLYPDGICELCTGETDGSGSIIENFDALGVCGGDCHADDDADGVCDVDEVFGCVFEWGCNYAPEATEDDGSCDPSCAPEVVGCGAPFSYHGYDYQTVKIGNQCWFAENLRSENYNNGDEIEEEYFVSNSDVYGNYYKWDAVINNSGLCPSGWKVPEWSHWGELINYLGGEEVAGEKLKASSGWENNGNGSNSSGFSALPGGSSSGSGSGTTAYFLSSTLVDWCLNDWDDWSCPSHILHFLGTSDYVGWIETGIGGLYSVRCIREEPAESSGCTDPGACNYDANPTLDINNELCIYADEDCESCSGEVDGTGTIVLNDFNGDGVCDSGCTDSWACNYSSSAEVDDESCEYASCTTPDCGNPKGYQGYEYQTVLIGDQCWFAENLRNEFYTNGEPIDSNLSSNEWQWTSSGAVSVYTDEDAWNCPDNMTCSNDESLQEWGRLYNWFAVDDSRGLCPVGWHVPTQEDWTTLTDELGGAQVAGHLMKSSSGWGADGYANYISNGSNSSGFTGLPGGERCRSCGGAFTNAGAQGVWWLSSSLESINSNNNSSAPTRKLSLESFSCSNSFNEINDGASVRCVQDE